MPPTPRASPGRAFLSRTLPGAVLLGALSPALIRGASPERPSLLLITLDTTRGDYVGRREGPGPLTPNLDALARRGTRYANAVTAAPLTLPAHCSLMTGLTPAGHGVRDNGISVLSKDIPTLASVLSARGYATGAFVSSRVLDRRFGLDRGFAEYDDRMVAERVGEQGYPERDARQVTDAALAWAATLPRGKPYFLWIHYYDPHSPYRPPGDWAGKSLAARYGGEVAYMDSQIGRLLAALPEPSRGRLVAAVGDHGEMLGEHGEKEHGVFLYEGSLAVPLILAGPGVSEGATIRTTAATRALAATLLALLNLPGEARGFGPALPGTAAAAPGPAGAVYSESFLPADTYGWSALRAATDGRWRYVAAPRPELYDLETDRSESRNRIADFPKIAARLRRVLEEEESGARPPAAADPDPELAASLRSLGYLSGASPQRSNGIDPKDGIALLNEFEQAKEWQREGRVGEAVASLQGLARRSPGNVPFLLRLGDAQLEAGTPDEGLKALRSAVALSPHLDFLRVRLAQAYAALGRSQEARSEYRSALELNPRSAPAWSGLAEVARRTGDPDEERRILLECEEAGTLSATLLTRLAQLERARGDTAGARRHSEEAARRGAGLAVDATREP